MTTTAARRITPDTEPRPPLVPDAAARRVLELIDVYREDATAWAAGWRERPPADQLRLADAKDLLRPLPYLVSDIADDALRSEVSAWLANRHNSPRGPASVRLQDPADEQGSGDAPHRRQE